MGWWSKAVMGGDGPCDIQCGVNDLLGMTASFWDRMESERSTKKDREKVRAAFAKPQIMEQIIAMIDEGEYDETDIGYQVLGVVMMDFGAEISDTLKARIIQAARNDEWAQDDEERKTTMESFISDLEKYDNKTPTPLSEPDQGLFAAIGKHIAEGKTGLVNK